MSLVLSNYNPYLSIVFRGIKNISNSYFPDVKFLYYNESGYTNDATSKATIDGTIF